jgi:hypothetical protein
MPKKHSSPGYVPVIAVALSVFAAALAIPPVAASSATRNSTEPPARRAPSDPKSQSAQDIAEVRAMGPEGLDAFLDANRLEIEAALRRPTGEQIARHDDSVLTTLDSICQQKDCFASRLYWYTDIEQAKSAARAQGRPILSLRLLGRLDEDLSCANSRLFRVALYANEQVSKLLRERFVLHWQSVRPAPRVTIDFGDGRKMERTLTGNSIHYVLDSEGRLIDALPGMYGPGAFLRELVRAASAVNAMDSFRTDEEWQPALRRYHDARLKELETGWRADVKQAGLRVAPSREIPKPATAGSPPSAQTAAAAAISKTVMVERPILRGMSGDPKLLDSIGSDAGWSLIAGVHARDATLDRATRALMSFKDPSLSGASLQVAVTALEQSVAEDTVRNEYVFRARIHKWLASGEVSPDVSGVNEKIYAELFLTPSWDAWLGLRPAGAYSGIDGDGVRK